jgi:hypothetical protein
MTNHPNRRKASAPATVRGMMTQEQPVMKSYLITPSYVLGSDSFFVQAATRDEAMALAKAYIAKEDWYADEWKIFEKLGSFEQSKRVSP